MSIRWQDKDPADVITVEFDFTLDATSVSSPTVTVSVVTGADPDPGLILVGSPTISGAIVRQRVQNGLGGVDYFFKCVASNGSDVLTIDAVLPVRARPIVVAYVPRYITEAQVERRFGIDELTDLQRSGNSFGQAEAEAASLIDGYLATRYTLPLVSVPQIVTGWAGDITRFKLWDERAPDEIRTRYDDALEQLTQLSRGQIALPPGSDGVAVVSSGFAVDGFSAERVFTAETLADY